MGIVIAFPGGAMLRGVPVWSRRMSERQRHHPAGDPHRAPRRQPSDDFEPTLVFAARQAPQALMICLRRLTLCIALRARAAGASPQAGDFGRPKPSLLEGLIPQQFWKGPVTGYSSYPLTDLEERAARPLLCADPPERAARQLEHLHRGLPDRAPVSARHRLLRLHRICAHAAVDAERARKPRSTIA